MDMVRLTFPWQSGDLRMTPLTLTKVWPVERKLRQKLSSRKDWQSIRVSTKPGGSRSVNTF